jgi:uncharacterized protein
MQVNLESKDKYSIEAYSDSAIRVDAITYQTNVIVGQQGVTDWPIASITTLNKEALIPFLAYQPEIILIGHAGRNFFPAIPAIKSTTNRPIAIEVMSIGAACRTFNILLNEQRAVVLGIIFEN